MRVVLLRHGPTEENQEGRYIGLSDPPLAPGVEAPAGRVETGVGRVYTSGKRRCDETAALLYPGAEIVHCAALAEMDFGAFEGKSWRDMEGDKAYRAWVNGNCEGRCPGGESREEFVRRVTEGFAGLLAACTQRGEQTLHIVAHGGTCMALGSAQALPLQDYFAWHAQPFGGYEFRVVEGERPLRLVGEIL